MSHFQKLKKFIDDSSTSIFCADTIIEHLRAAGFKEFDFSKDSTIPKGQKIFLRHKGLVAAFCLPHELKKARYLLAHTDSPCLKLKPQPIIKNGGMSFLGCEVYGAPLLSSYLGRGLKLRGHVALDTNQGIEIRKIKIDDTFIIPDPAIHLSKESNAQLDKGKLHALISTSQDVTLESLLGLKDKILSHDLFLVAEDSLKELGGKQKLFAGRGLDNLSSCFALLETLLETQCHSDTLLCGLFYDHEEIGSETQDGAKSHLIKKRLKKIIDAYGPHDMLDIHSEAYSLDVAHANHPSYMDKFDEKHPIVLGEGVVIKHHSLHKYAQDLMLFAHAKKHLRKSQVFTMRNEVGTGSTLGPYFSSIFSIATQDIGLPLLGMHSTCEIIAENDLEILIEFLKGFYHGK